MMTGSDSPEDFEAFAISTTPSIPNAAIAPNYTAPQHGPRPLPLFLKMLWQQTRNDTDFRLKAFAGLHKYQTARSEEHTSELQPLMRNSYAVFCLKKKNDTQITMS